MPCVVVVLVFLMAAILGAVALVATGRGGELSHEEPDRPPVRLPDDRMVDAIDINRLRFPVAFRGYRMDEVDRVLDRLAGELAERDRQIDALGQELLGGGLGGGLDYEDPSTDQAPDTHIDRDGADGPGPTGEDAEAR